MSDNGDRDEPRIENDAMASVDLSGLFNPTVLELALRTIITRITAVEKTQADSKDRGLPPGDDAKEKTADDDDDIPRASQDADRKVDDLAKELAKLRDRLGDLERSKPRSTDTDAPPSSAADGDRIAALEAKLAELQDAVNAKPDAGAAAQKEEREAEIRAYIPANLAGRLAKLEEESAGAKGKIAEIGDRADALDKSQVDQDEEIKELRDAAQRAKDLVADLEGRIGELEKNLDGVRKTCDGLSDDIGDLRGEHGKMQGRLGTLEGLTTLLNSKDAGDLGGELKSFASTLGDIQAKQAETEADVKALQTKADDAEKALKDLDSGKAGVENGVADPKKLLNDVQGLKDQLAELEQEVNRRPAAAAATGTGADTASRSAVDALEGRLNGLEKQLEDLARRSPAPREIAPIAAPPSAGSGQSAVANKGMADLAQRVNDLAKQLQTLQTAFDNFRDEARRDIKGVRDRGDSNKKEIDSLIGETGRISADLSKRILEWRKIEDAKANKADLDELKAAVTNLTRTVAASTDASKEVAVVGGRMDDVSRQLHDLKNLCAGLQTTTQGLANEKAGKDMVGHLSVDVTDLTRKVADLAAQRPTAAGNGGASSEVVDALRKALSDAVSDAAKDKDWTKSQLVEIRATVEHIHHSKADAALVANKAERDYVENAMEKLMREVEQVLNSTNAGLIDTIDKSLNILRDMIDGKATKDDVNTLKKGMAAVADGSDGNGNVPDGLTGYKGYRCLGCNRTMEGMRQRPMGSSYSAFLNRVPASPRVPRPPVATQALMNGSPQTSTPAGYLTGPPASA